MILRWLLWGAFGAAFVSLPAGPVVAQAPAPSPGATPPAAAPAAQKLYKTEELDQMLAPIALYPDALLSQMLMAATYPLEVVEAGRWSKANKNVKGDAAVKAVQDKTWDVSVKSLVATPQVIQQMSDQLEWTQKLGDAMLSQQQDVAASIQRLRDLAYKQGNLQSGEQQKVTVQNTPAVNNAAPQTIIIEPTQPDTVYVPSYQPSWAYGSWPYADYPPSYYPPYPGYGYGAALATGFLWGAAIGGIAGSWYGGWGWGGGDVNVDINRATNIDRNFNRNNVGQGGRWEHRPEHRKGAGYRDQASRERFGRNTPGADARQQFRGKELQRPGGAGGGIQRPGGGQAGLDRPGGGPGGGIQRPGGGAGQRPGGAGGGVQRPGGGGQAGINRPGGAGGGQRPGQHVSPGGHHGGAFQGVNRGGGQVSREAARGRQSYHGGGGGGGRHVSGGGRGGGGRHGGGGGRGGGGGGRGGGGRR
jgi:hypothetical protein